MTSPVWEKVDQLKFLLMLPRVPTPMMKSGGLTRWTWRQSWSPRCLLTVNMLEQMASEVGTEKSQSTPGQENQLWIQMETVKGLSEGPTRGPWRWKDRQPGRTDRKSPWRTTRKRRHLKPSTIPSDGNKTAGAQLWNLNHFFRSPVSITFFDDFFRSLLSITFFDHFFE